MESMSNNFQIIEQEMAIYNEHQKDAVDSILKLTTENTEKETKKLSEISKSKDIKQACNTASVYIEQYRLLLKHLGGEAYMSKTDKETIRDIFSSEEKLETVMDFMSIWNNREDECIRNSDRKLIESIKSDKEKLEAACAFEELWNNRTKIFADCIVDALQNKGFVVRNETTVFKKLDDDISLGFWNGKIPKKNEYYYAYGFTVSNSEKTISKRKGLKKILENNNIISISEERDWDDYWEAKTIYFNKIEDNKILIEDFIKNLIDQFDLLEKQYKSAL